MKRPRKKGDKKTAQVAVLMGSDSDLEVMLNASKTLDKFKIPHVIEVASAHRSPALVRRLIKGWERDGLKVIIAGAGCAAHLPGVVAGETGLPVIGVPLASPPFNGVDAMLSILPMPGGVPVATMAVGKSGAINAALLAVRILALSDSSVKKKLEKYIDELEAKVIEKNKKLKKLGPEKYLAEKAK